MKYTFKISDCHEDVSVGVKEMTYYGFMSICHISTSEQPGGIYHYH